MHHLRRDDTTLTALQSSSGLQTPSNSSGSRFQVFTRNVFDAIAVGVDGIDARHRREAFPTTVVAIRAFLDVEPNFPFLRARVRLGRAVGAAVPVNFGVAAHALSPPFSPPARRRIVPQYPEA